MSILLQINNIKKSYGPHTVLDGASFSVSLKQKIGVIGRNGAGKSTLFNIIMGREKFDSGEINIYDTTRIGYIEQLDDFSEEDTVLSYLMKHSGREDWFCSKIASRFELKNDLLETRVLELSGGFQMRVKLSLLLIREPNLLLLDEPTNYLDLRTMLLLENFLKSYNGAYLVISHDRRFIKNVCREIIDIENGKAYHFPGKLEAYLAFKREKLQEAKKYNKKQIKKQKHLQSFIDRFAYKASKASQAKSKAKQIKRLKLIDIEQTLSSAVINIPKADPRQGRAFLLEEATIGYPKKQVARIDELVIERGEHIALLGDNGQGKSTLMKTLATKLELLEGKIRIAKNLRIAYFAQDVINTLNPQQSVESYLESKTEGIYRSEQIYKMAGDFLFKDSDIKKPISVLSGGEKARLVLAGIFLQAHEVLLLDEPTNHLDFETAESLAMALAESNSCVIFISHDRTFSSIVADSVIEVKDARAKKRFGDYGEYLEELEESINKNAEASNKPKTKSKIERQREYEKKKKRNSDLKKYEKQIDKLRQEKMELYKYFIDNPAKPDYDKSLRLKEIDVDLLELEEKWMDLVGS